jgi:hypothetical protein
MADILKKEAVEVRRCGKTLFTGSDSELAHGIILRSVFIWFCCPDYTGSGHGKEQADHFFSWETNCLCDMISIQICT